MPASAWIITHACVDLTPTNKAYDFVGLRVSGSWWWNPMGKVGLTDRIKQRIPVRWLLAPNDNLLLSIAADPKVKRFKVPKKGQLISLISQAPGSRWTVRRPFVGDIFP